MRQITLKDITLVNFKGVHQLEVKFDKTQTIISGANGSGKTTIFDAFIWLLFGKNSEDRKVFNIKTLDSSGAAIPKIPHEVTATILVDGDEVRLQRRYLEKWVKKRGQTTEKFEGHEEERLYNDVPLSLNEWKEKMDAICQEDVFKFITNPSFFCAQNEDAQRMMIFRMAGDITDQDVAVKEPKFADFLKEITGKTMAEYRREIANKKSRIKEEMDGIPARIEERQRDISENIDTESIKKNIADIDAKLAEVDQAMADRSKAYSKAMEEYKQKADLVTAKMQEKMQCEQMIIADALKEYNELSKRQAELQTQCTLLEARTADGSAKINHYKKSIEDRKNQLTSLREEWQRINAKEITFNEEDFICPTCRRPLDADDIDRKETEMRSRFNEQKAKELEAINEKGRGIKALVAEEEAKIAEEEAMIAVNMEKIKAIKRNEFFTMHLTKPDVQPKIDNDPEHITIVNEIARLQAEIKSPETIDNSALELQRKSLMAQRDEQQRMLMQQQNNEANRARIAELETKLKSLNIELTALEGKEDTIADFGRTKAKLIEDKVKALFEIVRFKLFKQQVNGEYVETCEAMVNGVPYSDVNNADQINAGLDIINAICRYEGVCAPIFIDNAESINQVRHTQSQQVLLRVTTDKELKIEY